MLFVHFLRRHFTPSAFLIHTARFHFKTHFTLRSTRMCVCESCSPFINPSSQQWFGFLQEKKNNNKTKKRECVSEKWLNFILMCHRHRQKSKPCFSSNMGCSSHIIHNSSFTIIRSFESKEGLMHIWTSLLRLKLKWNQLKWKTEMVLTSIANNIGANTACSLFCWKQFKWSKVYYKFWLQIITILFRFPGLLVAEN